MTSQERADKILAYVPTWGERVDVRRQIVDAIDAAVAEAVAADRSKLAAAEARVKALEADNNKLKGELVSELCVGAKEERIRLATRVKMLEWQREALVSVCEEVDTYWSTEFWTCHDGNAKVAGDPITCREDGNKEVADIWDKIRAALSEERA